MGRSLSITGYVSNGVSSPLKSVIFTTNTIDPHCIAHGLQPRQGDVIQYNPNNCTRPKDGAQGSFTLDSNGVPTITGAEGTLGYSYGVYHCTFTFNGVSRTMPVSFDDSGDIDDLYNFFPLDANGFSVVPAGSSSNKLIYLDPTGGNDATATTYTEGSPPTGGRDAPSSVNAFQTLAAAFAELTDNSGDKLLIKYGETVTLTSVLHLNGLNGTSVNDRICIMGYGDPADGLVQLDKTSEGTAGQFMVQLTDCTNIFIEGLDIHPTYRDPDDVGFIGWGNSLDTPGLFVWGESSGIIIENCRVQKCNGGINYQFQPPGAGLECRDIIFRRLVVDHNFSDEDTKAGFFAGYTYTDFIEFSFYMEDCFFIHNGWLRKSPGLDDTATSGSTSTLTLTGAFAGHDLEGVPVLDVTNGGYGRVASHTDDTVTFTNVSGTTDFTGGGAFKIGNISADTAVAEHAFWGGMAHPLSHNIYIGDMTDTVIKNVVTARSSSIAIKITSTNTTSNSEPHHDFIEKDILSVDNELGLGGGGNTRNGTNTRFFRNRIFRCVETRMGESKPTGSGAAWGIALADQRDCYVGQYVHANTGQDSPAVDNVNGIILDGNLDNCLISHSHWIRCGKPTSQGLVNAGCIVMQDQEATPNWSELEFYKCKFRQRGTDGAIVGNWPSAESANVTFTEVEAEADVGDSTAYVVDDTGGTLTAFNAAVGGSITSATIDYYDDGVSLENYYGGTLDAYLTACLAQRKGNWDATLEAKYVVTHFLDGVQDQLDITVDIQTVNMPASADPSTYTLTYTAGYGIPKLVIALLSAANTRVPANPYANCSWSIGYATPTAEWCTHTQFDSEVTPAQICIHAQTASSFIYRSQGASTFEAQMASDGWDTADQISFDILENDTEGYYVTFVSFFGGDIDSGYVGSFNLGTSTSAFEQSLSKELDFLIASSCHTTEVMAAGGNEEDPDAKWSVGIATRAAQAAMNWFAANKTSGPSENTVSINNDSVLALLADGASETYSVSVDNISKNGLIINNSVSPSNALCGIAGLKFARRPKMTIVSSAIPTSGDYIVDPSFTPSFGFGLVDFGPTAYNTPVDSNSSQGMVVFNGSAMRSLNLMSQDNVTQTDDGAFTGSQANLVLMTPANGSPPANEVNSDGYTLDGDGLTVSLTANPSPAAPGTWLMLGGF